MLALSPFLLAASAGRAFAALTDSSLETKVNVLDLGYTFNPVKAAYWTEYPHHRRTPFAVSPDGKTAYLAYLNSNETDVHIQELDPDTFTATGTTVTVSGAKEAGGLVAHNDGFALLTNEPLPSGTTNAPSDSTPVPVLYRYTNGNETWKAFLGGPGVDADEGLAASPDLNGDLVYSEKAGLYGAYFVITDYTGDAKGHYGDSIEYVTENGTLKTITGATSGWGCSHNEGIAFEAADAAPFASICAEDQGAIWLNTETQGMTNNGVKISNENTTNGGSGEPMGGMSGSYSSLARFSNENSYIFSWVSRGAIDLYENSWMGDGYTSAYNRTNGRNVAIALFSDKQTKEGKEAISTTGATDGDSQVNWITNGTADCSNAHAATFDSSNALITWEEIADPTCDYVAMGCRGEFSGSYFQLVDSSGAKQGDAVKSSDVYVAGDMVTMNDGRICWPYVNMTWDLSEAVGMGLPTTTTTKMSFACMSLDGNSTTSSATTSGATVATTVASIATSATSEIAATTDSTSSAAEVAASTVVSSAAAATSVAETSASSLQIETASTVLAASSAAAPAFSAATTLLTMASAAQTPVAGASDIATAGSGFPAPASFVAPQFTPGPEPEVVPGFPQEQAQGGGVCEVEYVYV